MVSGDKKCKSAPSPKIADLDIEFRDTFVDFTSSNGGAIERELRGTVFGIDAAANDKVRSADFSLKLQFHVTFVMSMLHERVQFV